MDIRFKNRKKFSNQQIPGLLGNNINGVTNLDLTDEEKLLTSGLYGDAWDESSTSRFEDLPLSDDVDIQLECIFESKLFEHRGKSKDPNYTSKAAKVAAGIALTAGAALGGKKLLKNKKAASKAIKATSKVASKTSKAASKTKALDATKMSTKDIGKVI